MDRFSITDDVLVIEKESTLKFLLLLSFSLLPALSVAYSFFFVDDAGVKSIINVFGFVAAIILLLLLYVFYEKRVEYVIFKGGILSPVVKNYKDISEYRFEKVSEGRAGLSDSAIDPVFQKGMRFYFYIYDKDMDSMLAKVYISDQERDIDEVMGFIDRICNDSSCYSSSDSARVDFFSSFKGAALEFDNWRFVAFKSSLFSILLSALVQVDGAIRLHSTITIFICMFLVFFIDGVSSRRHGLQFRCRC